MHARLAAALLGVLLLGSMQVHAQTPPWPNRPLKLIVPQGPGAGTDVIARLIADALTQKLGQPVVVENLPAASGLLAHQTAARAAPDGYTFLLGTVSGFAINPVTVKSLPYDAAKDFTPVAMVVDFAPQMLSVNAELPVKSVPEFVSYAKANPGRLSYAIDVTVTAAQVSGRLLNKRAGLDLVEVPYRSAAQLATDVGSGRIQVTVSSLAASGAMIQAGKIRPLGWFGSKRFSHMPDTPTVSETVPGVTVDAWFVIAAPTGTPAEAVTRMNQEINAYLTGASDISARFAKVGLGVAGSGTPDSIARFIREEQAKWRALAVELKIEPQ